MKKTRVKRIALFLFAGLAALVLTLVIMPLPAVDAYPEAMVSCTILDRNGKVLREFLSNDQSTSCWVGLEHISPYLVKATIAAEDKRFYRHGGVDFVAVTRALFQNAGSGTIVSGASTITQQLAELMYHLPHGTFATKAKKMLFACKMEKRFTKKQILELYLNRVPYGNQLYGVETAARTYFGRPAAQLSAAQAAFLAGIPQAPTLYDPYRNYQDVLKRQKQILKAMSEEGYIDFFHYRAALNEPVIPEDLRSRFNAPHFCNYLYSQVKVRKTGQVSLILSTLDLSIQNEVEVLLKERIKKLEEKGVTNGAVVASGSSRGILQPVLYLISKQPSPLIVVILPPRIMTGAFMALCA